jgi:hypothetical protein
MQEVIAHSSLQLLSYYYLNLKDFFPLNLSKPTRIHYGSSVEWYTVEADITYIKKYFKNF